MDGALDRPEDWRLQQQLLRSLEVARTRLAVAMAAESKRIPLFARRQFADTEVRMRRLARTLRVREEIAPPVSAGCTEILVALEAADPWRRSGRLEANWTERMCRDLDPILRKLEEGQVADPL